MKKEEDMNIKIQKASADGLTDNKGKCNALAEYINHEDQERINEGKEPFPYMDPDGNIVTLEEVTDKINRNIQNLGKDDDKFYHFIFSPSEDEIQAMGETEREIYESGKSLMRAILDTYAKNFNRDGVENASDLVVFWKPHFTRGTNGELQFHIHGIISRNSKGRGGKKKKLSPLTSHRNTESGPVRGGFDRDSFFRRCERLFDKLFNYERKVAESYDYLNAMAHGTAEQKAEQIARLHAEEDTELTAKIQEGITRRREKVQAQNDLEELAALLSEPQAGLPGPQEDTFEEALNMADMSNHLTRIFAEAQDKGDLEFKLVIEGLVIEPIIGQNGGVEDIRVSKNGTVHTASSILDGGRLKAVLDHWWRVSGQKPAYVIRQAKAEKEIAQQKEKLQLSKGRGIR